MDLPVQPPLAPMLAKPSATIPAGMAYEPKWDGFRCLVFRDGDEIVLNSRNGNDLSPYFPELVAAFRAALPDRCVLDGELIVVDGERLDFGRLSERIHPAETRIQRLAEEWPASFVAWDLLAHDNTDWTSRPFSERRNGLEQLLASVPPPIHLTPLTLDAGLAQSWFEVFEGAGLDGVIAKPLAGTYQPGVRAMLKIKHVREADVVVAGYRWHKDSTPADPLVGSLQLALYSEDLLHFVGVAASFTRAVRAELAQLFALTTADPADTRHPWADPERPARRPGALSRWSATAKETLLIWPMPVATVRYEHMEGPRFRHTARFTRWRPDREPASCTYEQLEEVPAFNLAEILGR